jgi:hypothetical protein
VKLRITAQQRRTLRDNTLRILDDPSLQDHEVERLTDQNASIFENGAGPDSSEHRVGSTTPPTSEQLSDESLSEEAPPAGFFEDTGDADEPDFTDYARQEESPEGTGLGDELQQDDGVVGFSPERDSSVDQPEYTSVDNQLHDAELPWRFSKPTVDIPEDVSDVIPGTVIDRGPADDESLFDESTIERRRTPRKSPGEYATNALNRWSELHPALRIGIPLVCVLATLAIVVSMCRGPSKPPPAPKSPPEAISPTSEPVHQEITLTPVKVTDFCPARSTHATLAFSDVDKNAWVCVRAHGIDGARFEVYFDSPVVITSIMVVPGWDYVEPNGLNHWNEHRLVTRILWRLGGKQLVQNINPTPAGSTLKVPQIATVSMSGTIQETEAPPQSGNNGEGPLGGLGMDKKVDETFAIGKIVITGYVAGKGGG